jgi:hypothetical protein
MTSVLSRLSWRPPAAGQEAKRILDEDYWRLRAIQNLEPQTRRSYRHQWGKHILPQLGEYALRAVNAQVILRELVEPMRRGGAGASHAAASPHRAASDLRLRGHHGQHDRQPVRRVTKPRHPGGREVPQVPPATVEQLRARLGPADALMVSVLAYA